MNFLAHLYLSFGNDDIMLGNFIADHVKGKQIQLYENDVLNGILLHRSIDNFTDTHDIVMLSKQRLRKRFGKYAPVVADVFYDHFLAASWQEFHHSSLKEFADGFYSMAINRLHILPTRTQRMISVMSNENWLMSYRTTGGIHAILTAMSKRTSFVSNMENGVQELENHYSLYKQEFSEFFPELVTHSKATLAQLQMEAE